MKELREKWKSAPKAVRIVGYIILGLFAAVFFGLVFGFLVKFLWNWLMPDLFNLKEITYWQAIGLVVLARLLFGSFGGHEDNGTKKKHCKVEKDNIQEEIRHWEFYDKWWKCEGEQIFEDYMKKQSEEKENRDYRE